MDELVGWPCQSRISFVKRRIHANTTYKKEGNANEVERKAESKLQMCKGLLVAYDNLVEQNILLNSSFDSS